MPRYLDRHARTKGADWGSEPARSQQRQEAAADDPAQPRPASRKNPDLCKTAHWKGPHQPVLRKRERNWKKTSCRWAIFWSTPEPSWECYHEEVCTGCGKLLHISIPAEQCPDFHPITAAEQLALEQEIERWQERVTARRLRQPVIDGPQGYRKKKPGK